MKKKILFYYKMFFTGGTEHSILKLIKRLCEFYEIYVAYDDETSTFDVLNEIEKYAEVVNLNKIESISVDTCFWCSHSKQGNYTDFSKKVIAKKYFYWCHLLMFETFKDLEFSPDLRENMTNFICVSETVKKDIVTKYPELEEKCIVIDNYLNCEEIRKKADMPIDLKLDQTKLNIVTVARLDKDKGFGRMKVLCDCFDKRNIKYDWYVLGNSFKKEVEDEIKSWFKENKSVHFLGYKENVYPYVKNMDYLALLTTREACVLVITEALILGIPIIASSFEGVERQVIDKKTGIILDLNNTDTYDSRVNDIVSLKDILKENVQKEDYSKEKIIKIWQDLIG